LAAVKTSLRIPLLVVFGPAVVILFSQLAGAQCKILFTAVSKDELNNIRQGFQPKTLEWYQKKMLKKYPDVCYVPLTETPVVVMFFSSKPAVYHGVRTASNSGTITDTTPGSDTYGQQVATTSTDHSVPYEVEYQQLFLSIEQKQSDGSWKVLHNFAGRTLHPQFYGACVRNCHPNYANIERAVKWLHDGGLADPLQGVQP
jgi:hypothetical protein